MCKLINWGAHTDDFAVESWLKTLYSAKEMGSIRNVGERLANSIQRVAGCDWNTSCHIASFGTKRARVYLTNPKLVAEDSILKQHVRENFLYCFPEADDYKVNTFEKGYDLDIDEDEGMVVLK